MLNRPRLLGLLLGCALALLGGSASAQTTTTLPCCTSATQFCGCRTDCVCGATTSTSTSTSSSTSSSTSTSSSSSTSSSMTTSSTSTSTSSTTLVGAGAFLWNKQIGSLTTDSSSAHAYAVAVDGSGNVYVTGIILGTVSTGAGTLTSSTGGRVDMFVAKYGPGGVLAWAQKFGGTGDDYGLSIAADAGGVYVGGYFSGTSNWGGASVTALGYDIMLAKFNPANGALIWQKQLSGSSYEQINAVRLDGSGNVLIAGQMAATIDFGGGGLTSAGGYDMFVAKYNSSGVHQWSKLGGGTGPDITKSLAVDGSGNAIVAGYFQGSANFGGGTITSAGSNDVFVVKLAAADGAHTWTKQFGDTDDQRGYAVAADSSGNVVVTGYFYGTMTFGGTTLPATGTGGADIFLAKLNSSGVPQWAKSFGTVNQYGEVGKSVAIDGSGNVILCADVIRDVDLGGGPLTPTLITYDPALAKYNSSGVHQWSKRFEGPWDDQCEGLAVASSGNIAITGAFVESMNFGGGTITSPSSGTDAYLADFQP